jgi:hypothetical protein
MTENLPFTRDDADAGAPEEMCEFLADDRIVDARAVPGPHGPGTTVSETPGGRRFTFDHTRDSGVHVYVAET